MKIALAQFNPTVAAVAENTARICEFIGRAREQRAELVVFPEQAILGYPAKDLLLRRPLIDANVAALERIAAAADGIGVIVGYAEPNTEARGRPVWNSAAVLHNGQRVANIRKRFLPTYDVFDEHRYFEPAGPQPLVEFGGRRIGLSICEDLLFEPMQGRDLYAGDPCAELVAAGADLLINISASPYTVPKPAWRRARFGQVCARLQRALLYCNQVGGQDDLVFDGNSSAWSAAGACLAHAASCREDLLLIDLDRPETGRREPEPQPVGEAYGALVLAVRDYTRRCGFRRVVIGLSGGIDSALVATIAADALGPENVHGVAMPSRYSSDHSVADARQLAENLGVRFTLIPIEPMHAAYEGGLAEALGGPPRGATGENLQARVRGATLMALSNQSGDLLLTTGNKSELAVGYCTLYGDMCGGLAVISDVPKTLVYQLARHVNALASRERIPRRSIEKRPSAELAPNQFDQDTLPEYAVLDAILERSEERMESAEQIIAAGFDAGVVRDVLRKIHINEYKRRQAAVGIKITSRAFGSGRRVPIAAAQ